MVDVKRIREQLGMSQSEMARACNCHVMTISRWERGTLKPDGQTERLLELISYLNQCGLMPQYKNKKRFME